MGRSLCYDPLDRLTNTAMGCGYTHFTFKLIGYEEAKQRQK